MINCFVNYFDQFWLKKNSSIMCTQEKKQNKLYKSFALWTLSQFKIPEAKRDTLQEAWCKI